MKKQHHIVNNFLSRVDLERMLQDVKLNFENNVHEDELKSGLQTYSNLHIVNRGEHWKNFFKKLDIEMKKFNKTHIHKCWGLKIDRKHDPHYHKHGRFITSVYYLQNEDPSLGTHLKDEDIIIPGHENSIAIFDGDILHDAVFPKNNLKQPRYTLITDYYE